MPSSTPSSPSTRRRSTHSTPQPGRSTPAHSRRPSQASPTSHKRTTSRVSLTSSDTGAFSPRSPETPTTHSFDFASSQHTHQQYGGGDGLDSLEDELAGAWGDDDDLDESTLETRSLNGYDTLRPGSPESGRRRHRRSNASGTYAPSATVGDTADENTHPSPGRQTSCNGTPVRARRHTRTRSRYDGSDFGPSLEDEYHEPTNTTAADFTPEMRIAMRDVESLAQQLPDDTSSSRQPPNNGNHPLSADPIADLLSNLRNVAPQSALETGATRLITTHTSLTSHLAYQTRLLQAATYPLFSPLSPPPDQESIDALLPLLSSTLELLPQPSHTSLNTLTHLSTTSQETIATLAALSDSLHLCRQIEGQAARRLKGVREAVGEIRREWERAEVGRRYLEMGRWDESLRERRAAGVCREVLGGFESELEGWRRRLVERAGAGGEGGVGVGA